MRASAQFLRVISIVSAIVQSPARSIKADIFRNDIFYKDESTNIDPRVDHVVVFAVKQLNIPKLKDILYRVSDPLSLDYGKFLSREEVGTIISNKVGVKSLLEYLKIHEIEVSSRSLFGEYIHAKAELQKWETILSTKFQCFRHKDDKNLAIFRAEEYTLSNHIAPHISAVFNVIDFPSFSTRFTMHKYKANAYSGLMTPSVLNSFYNIFSNKGARYISQTVYALQYFSSTDLSQFQALFGIPPHPVDYDPAGLDNPQYCNQNAAYCAESATDLQWITAVAQNTSTSFL